MDLLDKVIDYYMPSDEMQRYLKHMGLSEYQLVELIFKSPRPIKKKLQTYADFSSLSTDLELSDLCRKKVDSIQKAMYLLETDGIFSVDVCCLRDEECVRTFEGGYASYDDAISFVESDISVLQENKTGKGYHWYELGKWIKDENGK